MRTIKYIGQPFVFFWLLIVSVPVFAQGVPHFTHHPITHPFHNPAAAVSQSSTVSLNVIHRSQWLGYTSVYDPTGTAPVTQQVQIAFPIRPSRLGIGVAFAQDAVGPLRQQYAQLAIGYAFRLNQASTLSFGLSPLYQGVTSDRNSYRVLQETDPSLDQAIDQQSIDVSSGLLYRYDRLQLGLSALQLRASGLTELGREYVLFSSYEFPLYDVNQSNSVPLWLTPALMLRAGYGLRADLSVMAKYNNKFWGGFIWRSQESVATLLGIHLLGDNSLSIGYGFEFVVTNPSAKQATSHEFLVSYDLPTITPGLKKPVYTPRFPL